MSNIEKTMGKKFAQSFERKIEIFNLSGWTLDDASSNGFPLSAHTDFEKLISFAMDVSPRVAYCFTSNAVKFSRHLSAEGIDAVPLE
jgi:hypothetical protein